MRRKWDPRVKAKIVLEGLTGRCVNELCRSHELRPGQYYKWREHFLKNCHLLFEREKRAPDKAELAIENEKLKRLVGELTLELNNGRSIR
ncbi:Transposase [Maridesulfovibrio ferrireducens]|uniref:Transposase n=1 Tax=Maridesulfovibrio ferrireducens TaxID=246191 RepID=A0A1G9HAW3_9BACT|nr:transposase [Maridesulfovibrio ferrireducens]SDL10158.1 Transposase [Maridesulfovibrio ferrireducens]